MGCYEYKLKNWDWNYRNVNILTNIACFFFSFCSFLSPSWLNCALKAGDFSLVRCVKVSYDRLSWNDWSHVTKTFPCVKRWSGRVFSGFGIWPKYGAGIGKTINMLTGSGIWLFPGKRDSPKIGYGIGDLCSHICRECRKPSRPTGSSGQSESTRRALRDVSFQTKHPVECLVNRS